MEDMLYHLDLKGWIHFIAALMAMLTGTWIVMTKKATSVHRIVGYVYTVSMVIVIATSFMIYRLFGGFGIFHAFALLSTFALVGGMLPMLKKNRTIKDLEQHATVMGWSVVGLYCAFISETCSRLHFQFAMIVLGIGCGITCTLGSILIKRTIKVYFPSISWGLVFFCK